MQKMSRNIADTVVNASDTALDFGHATGSTIGKRFAGLQERDHEEDFARNAVMATFNFGGAGMMARSRLPSSVYFLWE